MEKDVKRILTINSGSSSIKLSLYDFGEAESLFLSIRLERIGLGNGIFSVKDAFGQAIIDERLRLPDHASAFKIVFGWLKDNSYDASIYGIGHRVVHGGRKYHSPEAIGSEMLIALKGLIPFAPEHLPHEILAIEAAAGNFPRLRQIACFDTSFHRDMPTVARMFPLPRDLWSEGLVRYGFHGLSYEFVMEELTSLLGDAAARKNIIIAHLGNGASMAAVSEGKGMDTTMGFTPAGGLMMSKRTGDLDPGVLLWLLKEKGMSPDDVNDIINHRSGLLGVSGTSPDMEDLLKKQDTDFRAIEAVNMFCYQARKQIASLAGALGGLDMLVFTAGIGENSPEVRERITDGLGFLGIKINRAKNMDGSQLISEGPVKVFVIKTNEELMIARHTKKAIESGQE